MTQESSYLITLSIKTLPHFRENLRDFLQSLCVCVCVEPNNVSFFEIHHILGMSISFPNVSSFLMELIGRNRETFVKK